MALTQRAAVPLRRLGVRLPEGDWVAGLAPGLGTVLHTPEGQVRGYTPTPRNRGQGLHSVIR